MRTILTSLLYFSLLVLLLVAQSCTDESKSPLNQADTRYLLNYTIKVEQNQNTLTRVDPLPHEELIDEVLFLFFKPDDGSFVDFAVAQPTADQVNLAIEFSEYLIPGESYHLLIAANYSYYIKESYTEFIKTEVESSNYSDLKKNMVATVPEGAITKLLYEGAVKKNGVEEALFVIPTPGVSNVVLDYNISFKRKVLRIDLLNPKDNNFTIDWVKLVNYRDKGFVFSDLVTGDIVNVPESTDVIKPEGGDEQYITGKIYAFTNLVTSSSQNDKQTTALLIKGNFNNKTAYYRVNVVNLTEPQILRSNFIYRVRIIKLGAGYPSEKEALEGKDPLIETVIGDNWNNSGEHLVTDTKGNYLSVSDNLMVLQAQHSPSNKGYINVKVNGDAGWDLRFKQNISEDIALNTRSDNNIENSYFIIRKEGNRLSAESKSSNSGVLRGSIVELYNTNNTELTQQVIIGQLTTLQKPPLLTVDGLKGSLVEDVLYDGDDFEYAIDTGEDMVRWTVSVNPEAKDFISFTKIGLGTSKLNVKVKEHSPTQPPRTGTLTVIREDNKAEPVTIEFRQKIARNKFTSTPDIRGNEALILELNKSKSFEFTTADYDLSVSHNFDPSKLEIKKTNSGTRSLLNPTSTDATNKPIQLINSGSGESWANATFTAKGITQEIEGEIVFSATPKWNDQSKPSEIFTKKVILRP